MSTESANVFFSPIGLLMEIYFVIHVALPAVTWLMFGGRRDDKVMLWITGLSIFSLSVILIVFRPVLPPIFSFQIAWILSCIGGLLIFESFRREAGLPKSDGVLPLAILSVWATVHFMLYGIGKTETLGAIFNSSGLFLYCVLLFRLIGNIRKKTESRSLRIFQFSLMLYGVPSGIRPIVYFWTGDAGVINILNFQWVGNLLGLGYILAILFMSLGYWGFVLEKSVRERHVATAGQRKAETLVSSLVGLVEERNHLLLMNSRFSTINEFGSLSAMVVHDMAQPVQRLSLTVARVKQALRRAAVEDTALVESMKQLEASADETMDVVGALRNLVGKNAAELREVPVLPLLERIRSVMTSEEQAKGVALELSMEVDQQVSVSSIEVMLQRILLNVIHNAFEALSSHRVEKPCVRVTARMHFQEDHEGVEICVEDNGPGFPAEFLDRVLSPWSSSKVNGMGLGLMLANSLVKSWGGEMRLENGDEPGEQGAKVSIWLKTATPAGSMLETASA